MSRRGERPQGPLDAAGGPREGKGLAPPEAFSPLRGAGPWLGAGCLLRVKAPTSQRSFEHLPFCKVLFKALWGGGVRVVRGRRTSSRESQRRQTRCEPAGGRVSWGPTGASGPEAAGPPRARRWPWEVYRDGSAGAWASAAREVPSYYRTSSSTWPTCPPPGLTSGRTCELWGEGGSRKPARVEAGGHRGVPVGPGSQCGDIGRTRAVPAVACGLRRRGGGREATHEGTRPLAGRGSGAGSLAAAAARRRGRVRRPAGRCPGRDTSRPCRSRRGRLRLGRPRMRRRLQAGAGDAAAARGGRPLWQPPSCLATDKAGRPFLRFLPPSPCPCVPAPQRRPRDWPRAPRCVRSPSSFCRPPDPMARRLTSFRLGPRHSR